MNGRQAKRLRRIARTLERPVETAYAPSGNLRTASGRLRRRPFALGDCERRAIQTAKDVYKNG